MSQLDIVLLIITTIGFLYGYIKGLIKQLTFGAGIIIGLLQAMLFHKQIGQRLADALQWDPLPCTILAFIGIIILVILIFKVSGTVLATILKVIHLDFIDKTLGALFSSVIAIFLLIGTAKASNILMPEIKLFNRTSQEESVLYKNAAKTTFLFFKEMKEEIDEKKE